MDEKSLRKEQYMQHCYNVQCFSYKERQIILVLHLVLVTLHMRLTISIEQKLQNIYIIGGTKYNILCYDINQRVVTIICKFFH